ncbi:MAG: BA14K family protein [Nitratireductor sp.]
MKKTIAAIFTTALLATAPLTVSTVDAEAKCRWCKKFGGGVATGVGVGVGLGIVNNLTRPRQPDVVYVQPQPRPVIVQQRPIYGGGYSQAHYQWCSNRWRSYDINSNSYQPFNGPRRTCRSPYAG